MQSVVEWAREWSNALTAIGGLILFLSWVANSVFREGSERLRQKIESTEERKRRDEGIDRLSDELQDVLSYLINNDQKQLEKSGVTAANPNLQWARLELLQAKIAFRSIDHLSTTASRGLKLAESLPEKHPLRSEAHISLLVYMNTEIEPRKLLHEAEGALTSVTLVSNAKAIRDNIDTAMSALHKFRDFRIRTLREPLVAFHLVMKIQDAVRDIMTSSLARSRQLRFLHIFGYGVGTVMVILAQFSSKLSV